jgi:iron complex outermembrane recepter protein
MIRTLVALMLIAGPAFDAPVSAQRSTDLARASIEDLMNITVTSASRKEERANEVAAAIYVITRDDIRRSGMTTIPDLLRLAPGVQVAQINASKWAVSVRGFGGLYSNKLLVLVDGRSVYNHLFSGVMWELLDLMIDDIDRIEVIRGPGAAVWGANAVNGVINILTARAADSQGLLVRAGGGTFEPGQIAARYGGSVGNTSYRVYSQWSEIGDTRLASGQAAGDHWTRALAGVRGDWASGPRAFSFQGSVTRAEGRALWTDFGPGRSLSAPVPLEAASTMSGGTLSGRWTRTRSNGASLQIQASFDAAHRDEPVGDYRRRTADADVQYHTALGARQDLVVGGGYRLMHEQFAGLNGYSLTPETADDTLATVFAQDEIRLAGERLHLTLGAKVERESIAGWSLQPTARATWAVVPNRQFVWVATSRALRTPSLADGGIRVEFPAIIGAGPLPVRVSASGSPARRTEVLSDLEAGYRLDVAAAATISVSGFYGRYQHLATTEPSNPVVMFDANGPYVSVEGRFASLLAANSAGLELDARWTPKPWWRLDASYTAFRFTPRPHPSSQDMSARSYDGDASRSQWQVHSGLTLRQRAEVDVALYRVGALRQLGVPAYTRADARVDVPLTPRLTASLIGQNLLDSVHAEFAESQPTLIHTMLRRSARVQIAWRY